MTSASFDLSGRRVFAAGHRGMVGSVIVCALAGEQYEVLAIEYAALELRGQAETGARLALVKLDVVVVATGKGGGNNANNRLPANFIHDNLAMKVNLIHGGFTTQVANRCS
jgi:GDP-L-fucose synthase